jgi:hypothetical protein
MTDDERKATLERIADLLILSLETAAENFAEVIAGEKRIAFVKRRVNGQQFPVTEIRLSKPPKVRVTQPAPGPEVGEEIADAAEKQQKARAAEAERRQKPGWDAGFCVVCEGTGADMHSEGDCLQCGGGGFSS